MQRVAVGYRLQRRNKVREEWSVYSHDIPVFCSSFHCERVGFLLLVGIFDSKIGKVDGAGVRHPIVGLEGRE